jgi:hypothetical protein
MSPIDENGFLGEQIKRYIEKIRSTYRDFFELAEDMNRLCQKTMFSLDVRSRDPHGITVGSLYIRCLTTFQGLVLLAERGMMAQARVLARALIETLFTLCAIVKKPELLDVYFKEDKKRRLRFLEKFKEFHGGKLPENVKQEEIKTIEKDLKEDIDREGIRIRKTEEWAADAELATWYLTAYAVLSDSVHTTARDLEDHLKVNDRGDIEEFLWGPDGRGVDEILLTGIEAMHFAIGCTLSFFRSQRDKEVTELRVRFEKLVSQLSHQ